MKVIQVTMKSTYSSLHNNFHSRSIMEFPVDRQNLVFLHIISYFVMISTYENDKTDTCRNVVYIASNGWWAYLSLLTWEVVSTITLSYAYMHIICVMNNKPLITVMYIQCASLYVYIFKHCITDKLTVQL